MDILLRSLPLVMLLLMQVLSPREGGGGGGGLLWHEADGAEEEGAEDRAARLLASAPVVLTVQEVSLLECSMDGVIVTHDLHEELEESELLQVILGDAIVSGCRRRRRRRSLESVSPMSG